MVRTPNGNRPHPRVALVDPAPASQPPVPLSEFIDRPRELAALRALLTSTGVRLVTLTGPGGVGKTRIALQLAGELEPGFAAGVRSVPLASVSDPALIPASISLALGLRLSGDQRLGERLGAVLRQERMLLALDNFEHVLPAAPVVTELLQACPGLKVLITSRAPLRLTGEHVFRVPGMRQPDPATTASVEVLEAEAVELFVARAREATAQFMLTDENASDVAAICRRLDGLPLAIELAAARVTALPPRTLLDRLDRSLSLLTDGPRDAPDRLQTMRGAIAWSHQLLSPSEQVFFRRLSVFDGGCTLEAAEAVAGDGLDVVSGLSALVAGSLVQCHELPGDESRYIMLETIRQFALEQLESSGEEASIRDAHAAWCLALTEHVWPNGLWSVVSPRMNVRFNLELDNMRAALTWLNRTGGTESGLRLINLLWPYWFYAVLWREGRVWLERALAWTVGARSLLRVHLLYGAVGVAKPVSPDEARRAFAWGEEAVDIARELHDGHAEMRALIALGMAETVGGDYGHAGKDHLERAAKALEAALAIAQDQDGDTDHAKVTVLIYLLEVALNLGDFAKAERHGIEALLLSRRLDRKRAEASLGVGLAAVAYCRGDRILATRYCLDGLAIAAETPHLWVTMLLLDRLAIIIGEDPDQADVAATLGGAVERLHAVLGSRPNPDEQAERDRAREAARARLGDATFAAAWEEGRSMPLQAAISLGLTVTPPVVSGARGRFSDAITARELEVLRLIAQGQTDQEIADALFLSRRTVNAHVAHIFTRLDVATRREAVARGRELGLLTLTGASIRSA